MAEKKKSAQAARLAMREAETLRLWSVRMNRQLGSIQRELRGRMQSEMAQGELTGPQRAVMQALMKSGGLSLKELSGQVHLAHSTVSGIVDRLEAKEMVERRVHETDARVTVVEVSAGVRGRVGDDPLLEVLRGASDAELRAVRRGVGTLARLLGVDAKGCGE